MSAPRRSPLPRVLPADARFLAGPACLDFANTTERLETDQPHDWLTSYTVLLAWSAARGTLGGDAADRLARLAAGEPASAAQTFAKALDVRRDMRALAAALADGKPAAGAAALQRINRWLTDMPSQPAVALPRKAGHGHFQLPGAALDEPLWPILWSLTGLLTSQETCVRRCQGHGCGYYFVDATANRSRRFCSSEGCGNRTRARRFHRRHRA